MLPQWWFFYNPSLMLSLDLDEVTEIHVLKKVQIQCKTKVLKASLSKKSKRFLKL